MGEVKSEEAGTEKCGRRCIYLRDAGVWVPTRLWKVGSVLLQRHWTIISFEEKQLEGKDPAVRKEDH